MVSISGETSSGFEAVREVFEATAAEMGKGGAAFAAYLDGRKVVDVWGGEAHPGQPWERDTVSIFYSSSKVTPAVVSMLLYDRGELQLDVPVTRYWPEFGAAGKEGVTVRQLLSMQSGLPYVPGFEGFLNSDGTGKWDQIDKIEEMMAEAPPITPIGEPVYAPFNFGYLVNALVRRITGRSLQDLWNEEIAAPFEIDLWLGAPVQAVTRQADVYNDEKVPATIPPGIATKAMHGTDANPPVAQVLAQLSLPTSTFLRNGQGSADVLGNARGMARLYALLVNGGSLDGKQLVTPETVNTFTTIQSHAIDPFYNLPSNWMLGGIEGNNELMPGMRLYGPGERTFGKGGGGGQTGFADPDKALAVGFIRSHLTNDFTFLLQNRLVDTLYSCLRS